jgi:hypothetical protein
MAPRPRMPVPQGNLSPNSCVTPSAVGPKAMVMRLLSTITRRSSPTSQSMMHSVCGPGQSFPTPIMVGEFGKIKFGMSYNVSTAIGEGNSL